MDSRSLNLNLSRPSGRLPPLRPLGERPNVVDPDRGPPPPPPGEPGWGLTKGCDAERVILAGGALQSMTVHPTVVPFEQLYRRLPEEGMFSPTVSPERPFAFDLGSFQPPKDMGLLLYDLRPDIYRLDGINAGDFVPIEARRFASILGFEVTINGRHPSNIRFEVDPLPITVPGAFAPPATAVTPTEGAEQFEFDAAAANSFANAAGAGLSLLPQRPTRWGPLSVPFTLYVNRSDTVRIRCIVFRPIPQPIAFIEYDIAGMILPQQYVDAFNQCAVPAARQAGPSGSGPR